MQVPYVKPAEGRIVYEPSEWIEFLCGLEPGEGNKAGLALLRELYLRAAEAADTLAEAGLYEAKTFVYLQTAENIGHGIGPRDDRQWTEQEISQARALVNPQLMSLAERIEAEVNVMEVYGETRCHVRAEVRHRDGSISSICASPPQLRAWLSAAQDEQRPDEPLSASHAWHPGDLANFLDNWGASRFVESESPEGADPSWVIDCKGEDGHTYELRLWFSGAEASCSASPVLDAADIEDIRESATSLDCAEI